MHICSYVINYILHASLNKSSKKKTETDAGKQCPRNCRFL